MGIRTLLTKRLVEVRQQSMEAATCITSSSMTAFAAISLPRQWPPCLTRHANQHLVVCLCAQTSARGEGYQTTLQAFVDELKSMPVAVQTAAANEQHYEVWRAACCSLWCMPTPGGKTSRHDGDLMPMRRCPPSTFCCAWASGSSTAAACTRLPTPRWRRQRRQCSVSLPDTWDCETAVVAAASLLQHDSPPATRQSTRCAVGLRLLRCCPQAFTVSERS